ncbi:glycosyltransferase family 4 protein [bacterium]|nr:glycosyltransferase family 4 protein [bacterium]
MRGCSRRESCITSRAQDVRAWLLRLHVFAMTSRQESFGPAMAEAMAMGVPVVYTKVGGPAEIAHEVGLPFPPGDAAALAAQLEHLYRHPQERTHLGVLARRRIVEHFPLSAQVAATERLYRELLVAPS